MVNPLDVWAPIFRAPFSGDVTQAIVPRFFSPNIKGVPEIEHRVETEVASYGKQLGKILEALDELSRKSKIPLPEIKELIAEVEAVKADSKDKLRADAEASLARLKKADENEWKKLMRRG